MVLRDELFRVWQEIQSRAEGGCWRLDEANKATSLCLSVYVFKELSESVRSLCSDDDGLSASIRFMKNTTFIKIATAKKAVKNVY